MTEPVPHVTEEEPLLTPEQRRAVLDYHQARVETWDSQTFLSDDMINKAIDWFNKRKAAK